VSLPDPQSFVRQGLQTFDADATVQNQRQMDALLSDLNRLGVNSPRVADAVMRNVLEPSNRNRMLLQFELEKEAEASRQANARDEFGLNLDRFQAGRVSEGQSFSEGLQRFHAGESQAGRLGAEELARFESGRNVVQQDREFAIQQRAQELQAQGQSFDQAVRAATTEFDLREGEQRIGLNQMQANLAAEQQSFNQQMEAFREGRATTEQLEASAIRAFQAELGARQQTFENEVTKLQLEAGLSQAEAAEARAAFQQYMDYRRNEQNALLELTKLSSLEGAERDRALLELFQTSGAFIEGAITRAMQARTAAADTRSTNLEADAAALSAENTRIAGIGDQIAGVFS